MGSATQPSSRSHAVYGAGGLECDGWCGQVLVRSRAAARARYVRTARIVRVFLDWKAVFSDFSVDHSVDPKR